jgi:hypothetical protein
MMTAGIIDLDVAVLVIPLVDRPVGLLPAPPQAAGEGCFAAHPHGTGKAGESIIGRRVDDSDHASAASGIFSSSAMIEPLSRWWSGVRPGAYNTGRAPLIAQARGQRPDWGCGQGG